MLLDHARTKHYAWLTSPPAAMAFINQRPILRIMRPSLFLFFLALSCARQLPGQDRATDEATFRGNRAEIAITVRFFTITPTVAYSPL